MILSIEDTKFDDQHVYVTAIVEDMCLLRRQTRDEPDQWSPALCKAHFELDADTSVPDNEDDFCSYLNQLDLNWKIVDSSDEDLES